MRLLLMWSMELILLYVLLLMLKPSWVEIPLHAYFLLVGCQTLYSYLKAKSASFGDNQVTTVKVFAGVLTLITALCYVLHLLVDQNQAASVVNGQTSSGFFWQK